jgi:hypothetical protein
VPWEMRRLGLLDVIVLVMFVLPVVAVEVLLGFAFGWQVPVAFALAMAFLLAFASRPDRKVGAIRATMETIGAGLSGGVVGGLLLGGLGGIFGFVFGMTARLSQVPITSGPSFQFIRRKHR